MTSVDPSCVPGRSHHAEVSIAAVVVRGLLLSFHLVQVSSGLAAMSPSSPVLFGVSMQLSLQAKLNSFRKVEQVRK